MTWLPSASASSARWRRSPRRCYLCCRGLFPPHHNRGSGLPVIGAFKAHSALRNNLCRRRGASGGIMNLGGLRPTSTASGCIWRGWVARSARQTFRGHTRRVTPRWEPKTIPPSNSSTRTLRMAHTRSRGLCAEDTTRVSCTSITPSDFTSFAPWDSRLTGLQSSKLLESKESSRGINPKATDCIGIPGTGWSVAMRTYRQRTGLTSTRERDSLSRVGRVSNWGDGQTRGSESRAPDGGLL